MLVRCLSANQLYNNPKISQLKDPHYLSYSPPLVLNLVISFSAVRVSVKTIINYTFILSRYSKKSQVRQCLGFCTADFKAKEA